MQSVSSGIWTRVAVSISYDDNHYTTGTSRIYFILFIWVHQLIFFTNHKLIHKSQICLSISLLVWLVVDYVTVQKLLESNNHFYF